MILGKKAAQFFTGEAPVFRLYYNDNVEIYEFLTIKTGETYRIARREYLIGESVSDFLYADLCPYFQDLWELEECIRMINQGKSVDTQFAFMLNAAEKAADFHVFFWPIRQKIYDLYVKWHEGLTLDVQEFENLLHGYEALQSQLMDFISSCLNSENDEDHTAVDRYILSTGGTVLECPPLRGELVFGKQAYTRKGGTFETLPVPTPKECVEGGLTLHLALTLYPQNATELFQFLKYTYLKEGATFRPCKSCGRYFAVQGNGRSEYCNRLISGSSRTCKQAGAMRLYESKKSENPALRAYSKSYKTHNARIRYGHMTKEAFTKWSVEARALRDKCVNDEMSLEEFQAWLDRD